MTLLEYFNRWLHVLVVFWKQYSTLPTTFPELVVPEYITCGSNRLRRITLIQSNYATDIYLIMDDGNFTHATFHYEE